MQMTSTSGVSSNRRPIYLDGFATTALAPEARDAMIEAWSVPANASSPHRAGERAGSIVEEARQAVAALAGCSPGELTFTSGATEANNLAVLGTVRAALARGDRRRRIIVSAIEHPSVLEPALAAAKLGFEVVLAPVRADGTLNLTALRELLDERCLLVSVMAVNNETGIVQPVVETAEAAHRVGALLHCDAAQAFGKIPVDLMQLDADFASISAHKMHGPGGIGALYAAAGTPFPEPLMFGGGQQGARRPGTEPVGLIAGFGAASRLAQTAVASNAERLRGLEKQFLAELERRQVRFRRINEEADAVPGAICLSIVGVDADEVVSRAASEISISTGSACSSGQITTSHVLAAMGLLPDEARSVLRMLLDSAMETSDVEMAASALARSVQSSTVSAGRAVQPC